MSGSGRKPRQALLAVVVTCAILVASALMPVYGAAAPAGDVASKIATEASVSGPNMSIGLSAPNESLDTAGQPQPGGGIGAGGPGGSGGAGGDFGLDIDLSEMKISVTGMPSITPPEGSGLLGGTGGFGGASGGSGLSGGGVGLSGSGPGVASGSGGAGSGGGSIGGVSLEGSESAGGSSASSFLSGLGNLTAELGGGSESAADTEDNEDAPEPEGCENLDSRFWVCFEGPVVPGQDVTVTVLDETADPEKGAEVYFNSAFVGQTNEEGQVTGTVPYTKELRVIVREGGGTASSNTDRVFSTGTQDGATVNTTIKNINISVASFEAGQTGVVEVTAGSKGYPVPNATVIVAGDRVGQTNEAGRVEVDVPVQSVVLVRATRGELAARKSVQTANVEVSVRGSNPLGVVIPGQPATIQVTNLGDGPQDASVTAAGQALGETDMNGTVQTVLPVQPTVDITVETPAGITASVTKHIWFTAGGVLFSVFGLLVGAVVTGRRSSTTGRSFLEEARRLLGSAVGGLLSILLGLVVSFETTVSRVLHRVRMTVSRLRNHSLPTLQDLGAWLRAWLESRRERLTARASGVLERVNPVGESASAESAAAGEGSTLDARERIEQLWRALLSRLSLRRTRTMTPRDVAERAVGAGLPRAPVEALADAYRAVEYSSTDPASHVDGAERAGESLLHDEEGTDDT